MPLVTITSLKGRTAAEKKQISDAIQQALIEINVPETDRFQRFINLDKEDFIYDPLYPHLATPRSDNFVVIEVLLSVGRSVKIKKKFLETLINRTGKLGIDAKDIFVVFKETAWENWAFSGGVMVHI